MTDLEERIQVLEIKLAKLVEYLNLSQKLPAFGPPLGRADYDAIVDAALKEAGRLK